MINKRQNKAGNSFLKGENDIGVLLIHGWTSYGDELLPLGAYLNTLGYTVSAPMLRGHGTKPEDLLGVTREDWAKEAQEALEILKQKVSRIFIFGVSMGGNLAINLSNDPAVAGIITMGAAARYRFHALVNLALLVMGIKKYRRKYYPPWVRKTMGYRKTYLYYPVQSAREAMKVAEETRRILPRVTKPILLMQSTADHMVPKKAAQYIFNNVRSEVKEMYLVENAYHVFMDKKEVQEKIAGFISRISKK